MKEQRRMSDLPEKIGSMSENSKHLKWYENCPVQAVVATVWSFLLVVNVAWSTWPSGGRILSGLVCAGFAIMAAANARHYWRQDREAAHRHASAPDIEGVP